MKYYEVKVYTSNLGIEPMTDLLMSYGVDGVVVQDAGDFIELLEEKELYGWDYIDESLMELKEAETTITFYLEQNGAGAEKLQSIKEAVMQLRSKEMEGAFGEMKIVGRDGYEGKGFLLGRLYVESTPVDDADWKDTWKEYFKPAKITDSIVVKPTWEGYEPAESELVIQLDPGMAFGTGTHETTTLCVKLIEKYIKSGDFVLDIGCGSGILAICSALLGAADVRAVEIDPAAVAVAQENIELNGFSDVIQVVQGDLTKGLDYSAEIVAANLMADLVMLLAEDIAANMKPKGIFISSGILIEKQEMVIKAIRKCGFEILEAMEEGEWCAVAARLK